MKLIQNRNKNHEQVPDTQIKVQNIFHHFKTADDDGNDKAELLAISFHSQWGSRGQHTTGVGMTHQNTLTIRGTHTRSMLVTELLAVKVLTLGEMFPRR